MTLLSYNLKKCGQQVQISDRNDKIINGVTTEVFTNEINVKAIIKTVTGITVFDSTNVERNVTHELIINYIPDFESEEKWILFKGRRIEVLAVKNCCEKDNELVLYCSERGVDTKVVNHA